jgi:hypothetical protein
LIALWKTNALKSSLGSRGDKSGATEAKDSADENALLEQSEKYKAPRLMHALWRGHHHVISAPGTH